MFRINTILSFLLFSCLPYLFSLGSLCLCGEIAFAETSYPMVMCVQPVAVQVGQTT